MRIISLLRAALYLLAPLGLASTVFLYYYPIFLRYAFPLPVHPNAAAAPSSSAAFFDTFKRHIPVNLDFLGPPQTLAPFRMLTIGDPQLEGDTSIPTTWLGHMPHLYDILDHITFETEHDSLRLRLQAIFHDLVDVVFEDLYNEVVSLRKRVDLIGNDLYLAHIYRTMHWWTKPTHVTVLGDLIGSQWIDDAEFKRRGDRYWKRVFRGGERVPDEVAQYPADEYDLSGYLGQENDTAAEAWTRRIINIVGNHDVGYAGDLTVERMERFEYTYGKANYELRFEYPITDERLQKTLYDEVTNPESTRLVPELRLVIVNDMNLDTPAKNTKLQDDTYAFINKVIDTSTAVEYEGQFTVVLTHIPLHKDEGVCVDAPYFDFHDEHDGGGVREQYMLSYDASKGFLEGMLGMSPNPTARHGGLGRPGVILNGHDHAGCDTFHFTNQSDDTLGPNDRRWQARRWENATEARIPGADGVPGVREITVRSIMGDFGGNVGLFSAWFDTAEWKWKYEYVACPLGKQHVWWAVHVVDVIAVIGLVIVTLDRLLRAVGLDVEAKLRGLPAETTTTTSSTTGGGKLAIGRKMLSAEEKMRLIEEKHKLRKAEEKMRRAEEKLRKVVDEKRKKLLMSPPGTPLDRSIESLDAADRGGTIRKSIETDGAYF
ncbi:hypothetical protein TD95_002905 [Thielaviopsis punctulata]|uniref:Calcineurin-like phosphoesterase domain-containing protein n=1 Tax=Thielaviopsis punctulata TaxID=72032 RepID=A0A0F4ZDF7_9PEZI|nr:hypothetical protein TD95_002905 [Thielaviopsis punctulata]